MRGNILQKSLKPGQQLVTKEGDLWRWDGYKHTSKAKTPAEQMLKHKRELKEIEQRITKLERDIKNISLHAENIKEILNYYMIRTLKKKKISQTLELKRKI